MKKYLLLLILGSALSQLASAQTVLSTYPHQPMGLGDGPYYGVATDAADNVFVARNTFDYNTINTDSADSIIQKYSPNGTELWRGRSIDLTVRVWPSIVSTDVATDPAGNSYVLGYYTGDTMQLAGGAPLFGLGERELFIAKYSPNGVLQWSHSIGGAADESSGSIACDAAGNVVITGSTQSPSVVFGNGINTAHTVGSQYPTARFVAKFSTSGTALWAEDVEGYINDLTVSPAGDIYLPGSLPAQLQLTISSASFPATAGKLFLAKLTSSGVVSWVKTTTTGAGSARAVALNAAGEVYLTGTYNAVGITLDGVTLPSQSTHNSFLAKYTAAGQLVWAKALTEAYPIPDGIYPAFGFSPSDIKIDGAGDCLISGSFSNEISLSGDYFITEDQGDLFLGKFDAAGNYIWGISGGTDLPDLPGRIALDSQNNCYYSVQFLDMTNSVSFGPNFGGYQSVEGAYALYKINTTNRNRITGRVFYDFNSNGIKDGTDFYTSGIILQNQPGPTLASTGITGRYRFVTGLGNYAVTIPNPPLYYNAAPASQTGNFTSLGNVDTTSHFALQPTPNMQDLEITFAGFGYPRPGFYYGGTITYRNAGTTTLSGSVELVLDPLLNFQNSIPAAASQNGNTFTWNFTNLAPTQSGTVSVGTQVPATATLGGTVSLSAQVLPIAGDQTPANNTINLTETIVGSYDPNDKTVSQNWLTPTEVSAAKPLEYTIRFQNTGTDTAFTVRLIDTLDAQLNIPTFEMLSSSHNYTWSIRGNGILEWRFDNILLPDSNTNEAASHGFVKYRIRPNTNLALGSIIRNTAAIYFDFNEPVITNTTTTEVALVSAVADVHKPQLQVYPNPNKGVFMVQLQNVQEQTVQAELRNVLGQTVWQQNLISENGNVQQQIKTSNLSKGIYYLQVSTGKGNAVQKVVIE